MRYISGYKTVSVYNGLGGQSLIPMGQPAQGVASSSLWLLGALGLGLFLWGSSERKHSNWF